FLVARDFVAMLLEHFFHVIDQTIKLVASFDLLPLGLVLGRMGVSFLRHTLHFFLAQTGRRRNRDLLVFVSRTIFRRHIQDGVGINIKRDFNLRDAAGGRRNSRQMEFAERAVVLGHWPLALQHVNFYRCLAVGSGGKGLRLARGDRCVARDHARGHAAQSLDGQSQWRHVQQQQVFHVAREYARLHGGTYGNHFVRVHAFVRLLAEHFFHQCLNPRHARLSADEHVFVNFAGVHARVLHRQFARVDRTLDDVFHHLLELRPGQFFDQVLGTAGVGSDERQIDLGFHRGRKLNFGFFGCIAQTLQGHLIPFAAQVQAFIFLEFVGQPIHQALINIVTAQVGVTVGRLHLNHTFADFKNRNVEGASAEVIHSDGFFFFVFIQAVGNGRRRWLIYDTFHVQACNLARVLGRLALRVIEIRRHRNHRFRHRLAEIVFRSLLQFLQNHRRDLRRSVFLSLGHNGHVVALTHDFVRHHLHLFADFVEPAPHEALDRVNGVLWIGDGLALGHLAYQTLAGFGKPHYRRRGPSTFFIGDNFGLAAFHHRYHGVGGAQIDSDNFAHGKLPPKLVTT